jgi:NADH-quinone oxidoreductase subunit L
MSQIGYMMFALGVSGYGGEDGLGYMASMFHLFTHAFFKSLLFLGAGAVIHRIHSNEMKDMGGLRKSMPLTHITFLVACLAIAGIPPFAGFFSKEEILLAAFHSNKFIYGVALLTAGLTAFYMFRLYFSIFWKTSSPLLQSNSQAPSPLERAGGEVIHHGEGTWSMKIPLIILAVCSLLAGLVPFANYITSDGAPLSTHMNLTFSIAPIALALGGILIAAYLYKSENDKPARVAETMGAFYRAAYKKFYIDEVFLFITKKIIFNLIGRPAAWIDKNIVDGFMNLLASATGGVSSAIKGLQSGRVQSYAIYFFGGIIGMAALFIYWWK